MLCEAARFAGEGPGGLLLTWGLLTALALPTILGISAAEFRAWYYSPRYEQWRTKSNPCYPEPAKVRSEVLLTLQCGALSVLPAALALHLAHQGRSKAYCGLGARGWGYELGAAAARALALTPSIFDKAPTIRQCHNYQVMLQLSGNALTIRQRPNYSTRLPLPDNAPTVRQCPDC